MTSEYSVGHGGTSGSDSNKNNKEPLEKFIVDKAYEKFLEMDAADVKKVDILLALDYIHDNLLSPSLSVKKVITECRIRTHTFHGRFAREIALIHNVRRTPGEYIDWARIQVARRVLDNRDCYLKELASKVGFGSYPSFYRACRKHMGCRPSELLGMNKKIN